MSEAESVTTTNEPTRHQSVAEMFHAAGLVTARSLEQPRAPRTRRRSIPVVVSLAVVVGGVAVLVAH